MESVERRRKPPLDSKGLRTDGPTLAEWVRAGYKAEHYPPQGYADKRVKPPRTCDVFPRLGVK